MKSNFILSLVAAYVIILSCNNSSASGNLNEVKSLTDFNKEETAILAVIEKETTSFYGRDYNAWKNTRSQTDYEFQAWNNQDGTFDAEVGWREVNSEMDKFIKENPESVSSHPKVIRKNIKCKFFSDTCAYLTWDQYNSDKTQKKYRHSKDLRIMEKQGDEWKIVTVAAFWDYKNVIPADSLK